MSNRSIGVDDRLYQYILDHSLREPDVMARLRAETAAHPHAVMQISPEQGQFMQMLVKLMGAKNCIEIGTFTGYSALAVAMALPKKGKLVACDISAEYPEIGKPYWKEAGVHKKIDLRIGPATKTLKKMIKKGESGKYDFAFIDADKTGYADYYEGCLKLLRKGGLMAVDNVLWSGSVANPRTRAKDTLALKAFNKMVLADDRIELSMLPVGDGLTLVRKV